MLLIILMWWWYQNNMAGDHPRLRQKSIISQELPILKSQKHSPKDYSKSSFVTQVLKFKKP